MCEDTLVAAMSKSDSGNIVHLQDMAAIQDKIVHIVNESYNYGAHLVRKAPALALQVHRMKGSNPTPIHTSHFDAPNL
jgi:hypothetical protein